jgi:hypothetical protein
MSAEENSIFSRRQLLTGGLAAIAGGVAFDGFELAHRALASGTPQVASRDCQPPGNYEPALAPSYGPPGSLVKVSGAVPTRLPGLANVQPAPSEIRVWWNLEASQWYSALTRSPIGAKPGVPAIELARLGITTECEYSVSVKIPDEAPGDYPIFVLYSAPTGAGFSDSGPVTFAVTG